MSLRADGPTVHPELAPLVKNTVTGAAIRFPCAAPANKRHASGGSLSFAVERKGGKNAAKTNGFGILFAAEVLIVPVPFSHANPAL